MKTVPRARRRANTGSTKPSNERSVTPAGPPASLSEVDLAQLLARLSHARDVVRGLMDDVRGLREGKPLPHFQMVWKRHNDPKGPALHPTTPYDHYGRPVVPDGLEIYSIEQAAAVLRRPWRALAADWKSIIVWVDREDLEEIERHLPLEEVGHG